MEFLRDLREFRERVNRVRALHPRTRILRDRSNPLEEYNDTEFRRRFRFTKETTAEIAEMLHPNLQHMDGRGLGLPVMFQLLVVLRFYATGAFHLVVGDTMGIHESKVCQIVKILTQIICSWKPRFIYFPTRQEQRRIKFAFSELSRDNFPGILGAIDCTHIRIQCPKREEAERFYNRKRFYSINCQVICDSDMKIRNIVARWPGATHDSRIFRNSRIKEILESRIYSGHLIGDSGYACTEYLLTPVVNDNTERERRYNTAHKKARNIIERTFGSWKKRFPCLHYTLRTKINTSLKVIIATAILHNLAIKRREEEFEDDIQEEEVERLRDEIGNLQGLQYRDSFIRNHFS